MNPLKKLAGQTAIYGVGTILGRILNYLLTPLYTGIFSTAEYAVYSEGYAYIAILLVFLTFGMETALFHFCQKNEDKPRVFSTALISLAFSTSVFLLFIFSFSGTLASLMKYPGHTEYVQWIGLIIGLDAITALPMAWLRQQNKPRMFTGITLINIAVNIGLNLFFLVYCRQQYLSNDGETTGIVKLLYRHEIGIGYIFIANLAASFVKTLLCLPIVARIRMVFDKELLSEMARYAWPLIISGMGFIINERLDVLMLKYWLPLGEEAAKQQIGIYSGCYKLAILMSIFIQAYRFAAEPFFFNQQKEKNSRHTYAKVMNYFVILCCIIFLTVSMHIDIFKYFIQNESYREGLKIVPIIMLANLFLGVYVNLSMWYKLSGQTMFGAWFSVLGAVITIVMNILLIPRYGYMASAWTTFAAYFAMMAVSYFVGQRYYPIPYNVRKIFLYIGLSALLYYISSVLPVHQPVLRFLVRTLFMAPFFFVVYTLEAPVKNLVQSIARKYVHKS